MTITHSGGIKEDIVFELFTDIAPNTCNNFLALCKGFTKSDGTFISYQNTEIHRIVAGMYIQGGRISKS